MSPNTNFKERPDSNVVNRLRRLKIQESLLVNSIDQISQKAIDSEGTDLPVFYNLEFKQFAIKLKKDVAEIANVFEDIKAQTEENFTTQELENMKKDALKLDDKIRIFKNYLQSEIATVTSKKKDLIKKVNDDDEAQLTRVIKFKTRIKTNNHIGPSPVKVMIKAPFICEEAQQLQEFLRNSPNRYGGWNEYNHNIFVKIWPKYFKDTGEKLRNAEVITPDNRKYQAFEKNALQNIAGSTREGILSHYKWYSKYLYLKNEQRIALNKWKKSKRMISKTKTHEKQEANQRISGKNRIRPKGRLENSKKNCVGEGILKRLYLNEDFELFNSPLHLPRQDVELSHKEIEVGSKTTNHSSEDAKLDKQKPLVSTLLKPTKQWTNRCNTSRDIAKGNNDLENIKKLRVPDWRLALQE